jgi:alkanesulfonate monooxygenase SsuD/methylene tetrahydromethanopterin reductase-like flavin-dependent oxidoreductase (luciferase family)
VVLAAIGARTKRIHLGSAVTVLSSDDAVRVFQRFSTLDAISQGRAEVILGRGSFTESFPLFGYDLNQYEELFDEKLSLFAALVTQEAVTWRGNLRPPLTNQRVFPPIEQGSLQTWIGVGGSPDSVVRAAHYGFPLMLAIIGGEPARFRPYVDLFTARWRSSASRYCRSACIVTAMWRRPTSRRAPSCGPTTSGCATASAPNAAGRRCSAGISIARPTAARCMSARPKRSRARSPRP